MSDLYVACELGAKKGRILLGALQKEGLTVSEAGEFQDLTNCQDCTIQWDVSRIYQQVLTAVRSIVAQWSRPVSMREGRGFERTVVTMQRALRARLAKQGSEMSRTKSFGCSERGFGSVNG